MYICNSALQYTEAQARRVTCTNLSSWASERSASPPQRDPATVSADESRRPARAPRCSALARRKRIPRSCAPRRRRSAWCAPETDCRSRACSQPRIHQALLQEGYEAKMSGAMTDTRHLWLCPPSISGGQDRQKGGEVAASHKVAACAAALHYNFVRMIGKRMRVWSIST